VPFTRCTRLGTFDPLDCSFSADRLLLARNAAVHHGAC
jgi:hypothetical protein